MITSFSVQDSSMVRVLSMKYKQTQNLIKLHQEFQMQVKVMIFRPDWVQKFRHHVTMMSLPTC